MEKNKNKYLLLLILASLFFQLSNTSQPHFHKQFVFIHGSCHGAWSWFKLLPLLESSGHHVTALDLPTSGIDLRQPDTVRSISQYFQPLTEFMSALPRHQKVILVGHSLGGLAVAKAMEEFPARISAAVFVTASMPGPALNISMIYGKVFERNESMMDSVYSYGDGPNRPPTAALFGFQSLSAQPTRGKYLKILLFLLFLQKNK